MPSELVEERHARDLGQLDLQRRPEPAPVARDVKPFCRGEQDEVRVIGGNRDVHSAAQPSARLPPGQPTVVRDDERRSAVDDRDDGGEIGRAACKEREEIAGFAGLLKKTLPPSTSNALNVVIPVD